MIPNNIPEPEDNELDLTTDELSVLLAIPDESMGTKLARMLSVAYVPPHKINDKVFTELVDKDKLLIKDGIVETSHEVNILFAVLNQAESYLEWSAAGGSSPSHHKAFYSEVATIAMYAIAPGVIRFIILPPDLKVDFYYNNYLKEYESYSGEKTTIQVSATFHKDSQLKAVNAFRINGLWEAESGQNEHHMRMVDDIRSRDDLVTYVSKFFV